MHRVLEDFPSDVPDQPELVAMRRDGDVLWLTIERPEVMNCLSFPTLRRLRTLFEDIAKDTSLRAILVTGSGEKAFCAGADLKERKTMPPERVPVFVKNIRRTMDDLAALPQPTIGVVNGVAFGGGMELLLACDLRVCAPHAQFGLTETSLAIIPGAGGTQRLPRLIGRARAKELILTARRFDAIEAERIGVVNRIAPEKKLAETALEIAQAIAANGPVAVRAAKAAIDEGCERPMEEGLEIEARCYERVLPTQDRLEALAAFAEKRKPTYSGRWVRPCSSSTARGRARARPNSSMTVGSVALQSSCSATCVGSPTPYRLRMSFPLAGKVALVAGATRGAGRGIAVELGAAGATVYVTGRSTRFARSEMNRPETIEETAALVTKAGGRGIAVCVDHLVADEVRELVARIRREQGALHVLVNDIFGATKMEWGKTVWESSLDYGLRTLRLAIDTHAITSHCALPLLIEQPGGLVVEVTDGTDDYNRANYRVSFFYDLAKAAVNRMAFALAHELKSHGATAVSLTPGWLRSEAMLDAYRVTEANWRDAMKVQPHFAISETPAYVGRAVVALASDSGRARWNGESLSSGALAKVYGFCDVDGSQPDAWRYLVEVQDKGLPANVTGYR